MPAQKYLARCVALNERSSRRRRAVGSVMPLNDFIKAPGDETSNSYPKREARSTNVFYGHISVDSHEIFGSTHKAAVDRRVVATKQCLLWQVNGDVLGNSDIGQ